MTPSAPAPPATPVPGAQRFTARSGDYWLTPLAPADGVQLAWGCGPGQSEGWHELRVLTSLPQVGTLYSICRAPGGTVVIAAVLADPAWRGSA